MAFNHIEVWWDIVAIVKAQKEIVMYFCIKLKELENKWHKVSGALVGSSTHTLRRSNIPSTLTLQPLIGVENFIN